MSDDMTMFLMMHLMIQRAKDPQINPRELECHWYAAWMYALLLCFKQDYSVAPQHTIRNLDEGKDGSPDFVVTKYHQARDNILLIVENKPVLPEGKDMKRFITDNIDQLVRYVKAHFSDCAVGTVVFGLISVGQYWQYYKYEKHEISDEISSDEGSEFIPSSEAGGAREAELEILPEFQSRMFDLCDINDDNLQGLAREVKRYAN